MDVAPVSGPIAAGKDTTAVAYADGASLGRSGEAGLATRVQDHRIAGHHHTPQGGLAAELLQSGSRDRTDALEVAAEQRRLQRGL